MTTVINMPPSLDDRTFESVLQQLAPLPPDEKVLLDTRHTRWASQGAVYLQYAHQLTGCEDG